MSFVDIPGYTEVGPVNLSEFLYGSDRKHTKDMIKEFLSKGIFSIGFTKANGDTRYMTCTRDVKVLKEYMWEDELDLDKTKRINEDTLFIPVFDLDLEVWRGFVVDRLFHIEMFARINNGQD